MMDDDDDALCPCFVQKGKGAHNPDGSAGGSGIQTPLEIDNGSGSVPQTRSRGLLEDLAGNGGGPGIFSLVLDGRLGNGRSHAIGISADYKEN